jgi:NADH-quinone oxidoreductase subunit A
MQLADVRLDDAARETLSARLLSIDPSVMTPDQVISPATALQLGWLGLVDILVFFCVLLVGFAYVWKRGDLDWIRALTKKSAQASDQSLAGVG